MESTGSNRNAQIDRIIGTLYSTVLAIMSTRRVLRPLGLADIGTWTPVTSLAAKLYSGGIPSGNTALSGTEGLRINLDPPGMYGTALTKGILVRSWEGNSWNTINTSYRCTYQDESTLLIRPLLHEGGGPQHCKGNAINISNQRQRG